MYSYSYDIQTGGLLLNFTPTGFSKEPRPVYAPELDVLGFDSYWTYDKQTDFPYMWAEANHYYYRGTLVAKLKGGNAFTAPEILIPNDEEGVPIAPEPNGAPLKPVDIEAMVDANREILDIIEQTTVKKILAIYTKYKNKLDCFHVAFSGGKDSCVLLDLVKKALPRGSFVVVFGDTGMEFPDTSDIVNETQKQCIEEEIPFYIAKSHLDPKESWELFGPPSRVLRWCCSVHKSAPQTLKLREITGKDNYKGLAYVGVRAHESAARAEYEYFNDGKKIKGQYSHNSILEWTSAEVWLYIFKNNVLINEAYKRGSARVGCLCCPMGGGKAAFIECNSYRDEIHWYFEKIEKLNGRKNLNINEYIKSGGWGARKNGRDLAENPNCCSERIENGFLTIETCNPSSSWREWLKTVAVTTNKCLIKDTGAGYIAYLKEATIRDNPLLGKLFRQVFHKAAYCVGCRVCEANCPNGAIQFVDNKVHIDGCVKCQKCHAIDSGCLLYHSRRHPTGGGNSMRSLNTMSNHAPKVEWLSAFFEKEANFFIDHNLGPEQFSFFKRFLKDAGLTQKNKLTPFASLIIQYGWTNATPMGLILINLVFANPQMEWYVVNLDVGKCYARKAVVILLARFDIGREVAGSICGAFKRIVETPLGTTLHFGHVTEDGALVRTKCLVSDPRVVLYGLFKFAEKCNSYKEFTLASLLNDSIDRDGLSPTRIFGLDRDDTTPILLGLSAKYPEFITASFTHDLEKIKLAEDKSSQDVLDLFKEGTING